MDRDSLFSEKIVWSGGPAELRASPLLIALAGGLLLIAIVAILLAIAQAEAAIQGGGRLVLFAAWCCAFALSLWKLPLLWAQGVRYTVTDKHVIWQRGSFKRIMQRDAISYARIHWSRKNSEIGDLELVRAVPTGALRRRLTLSLASIRAPDRVWCIVRGVPTTAAGGSRTRPMPQRLDSGERVLWSCHPARSWKAWLPLSTKRAVSTAFGLLCLYAAGHLLWTMAPLPQRLLRAGFPVLSKGFLSLVSSGALTVALLASLALAFLFVGIPRRPRLDRRTTYLVTDHRVLLQRGHQEIHLDRTNIVDLADRPGVAGARDVYLVMDGPGSRAVAASGAFGPGEGVKGFLPVLRGVRDVDGLRRALALGNTPPSPEGVAKGG